MNENWRSEHTMRSWSNRNCTYRRHRHLCRHTRTHGKSAERKPSVGSARRLAVGLHKAYAWCFHYGLDLSLLLCMITPFVTPSSRSYDLEASLRQSTLLRMDMQGHGFPGCFFTLPIGMQGKPMKVNKILKQTQESDPSGTIAGDRYTCLLIHLLS